MSERKKILWLVSWYPNKYDRFDGDFIQRHAKAAALYDDIHVLFVKQHEGQSSVEKENDQHNGLSEEIIYLPKKKGLFAKFTNYLQWRNAYRSAVSDFIESHHPSLIHVHVPWKAGLIALWAKRKYKTPYIVTEHWGIYNKIVHDNIYTKSFFTRYFLKQIFQGADNFISVSKFVGEGVIGSVTTKAYSVIPNVVDTSLFFPVPEKNDRFTFLHVSNMVPLKNVEGILKAFEQFLQIVPEAQLLLIGNRDSEYEIMARQSGMLNRSVFFKGEIPYQGVAKEMQRSHALILNSNIENSPCVIGEALCCGLPVIATNVGGVPELISIRDGELISPRKNEQLLEAMSRIYHDYNDYLTNEIAAAAKAKFSYSTVGAQFHAAYKMPGQ